MLTRAAAAARFHPTPVSRAPAAMPPTAMAGLNPAKRGCACGGGCPRCTGAGARPKLLVGDVDSPAEREADAVASAAMRAPVRSMGGGSGGGQPVVRRLPAGGGGGVALGPAAAAGIDAATRGGEPLPEGVRAAMEPRFGADFSHVRIHRGSEAAASAAAIGARAYTVGNSIAFGQRQWAPGTASGDHLIAHELAHTLQNGDAAHLVRRQPLPGTGMVPPGDCGWAEYLVLRGSVETAKAVVNMVGACRAGDSCLFLAMKIAAITAEIAARVTLDATCFRGGDEGHREQIQGKVNMMNRCYEFFTGSNCSPELIAAMAVVVAQARAVIAATAAAVALALVVALIAAIIALVELIAAAAAAAAEAAAIAAAAAAVLALLVTLKESFDEEA